MNKSIRLNALLLAVVLVAPVLGAEPIPTTGADQALQQPRARGRDLMTPAERAEHRQAMRQAKSAAERRELRLQMHKKMQERAKEKGVTLPEAPLQGGGMGGSGMGKNSPP